MSLLRTEKTQETYETWVQEHAGQKLPCFICAREPKILWEDSWKIIPNDFPYDAIAWKSDLIAPVRHFANKHDMTKEERKNLDDLLTNLNEASLPGYDAIFENFHHGRTEKGHYHLHLFALKNYGFTYDENGPHADEAAPVG